MKIKNIIIFCVVFGPFLPLPSLPPPPKNYFMKLISEDIWKIQKWTNPCLKNNNTETCLHAEKLPKDLNFSKTGIMLDFTWTF